MATGRILGRGRVLGSAKSASSPSNQSSHSAHNGSGSLLSPSGSIVSSASDGSPPIIPQKQDLVANVSLETTGHVDTTASSSRLVCPICNDEMVTLLQLNRHLDDMHANLEEIEQDEVKDWFRDQLTKAKKFQPLAVLNQKFKGLDIFEANDSPQPAVKITTSGSGQASPELMAQRVQDPEESVTRTHWQKPGYNDFCADPMCGKKLGGSNGNINCRKCGALYCNEHTMYQMKLSRSARHEPVRGIWCRVCETCYKSREGYNDHRGQERDHTDDFMKMRRRIIDKKYLEISRLEKRLSKLTHLLATTTLEAQSANGSMGKSSIFGWTIPGGQSYQRSLEQSVVPWEDDSNVVRCPFCQQDFSNYTFRRHHCRTCGRVICSDPKTECSVNVALDVVKPTETAEKTATQIQPVSVKVRLCKECRHTLFAKSDFDAAVAEKPPDQRAYEHLIEFESGIRLLIPRFQKLLSALQDPESPPTKMQIDQATKTRKRLTDSFVQYQSAATRIRDLPTSSQTQQRLQKAVYSQAMSFLHLHMLPLKSLPKILKHATPMGKGSGKGALALIHLNSHLTIDAASQSSRSSAIESMETEEKELRERLILLEEQMFIVGETLNDARKKRRFDDVKTLQVNLDELSREADLIQKQLAGLDFASTYAAEPTPELHCKSTYIFRRLIRGNSSPQ
ncbi:uncharacterized protein PV09_09237 [Verruconis gallopava]|uniref:FYVE-type domain-containing protein n=1 Tax=Verruconis gallopava TaxID=253628 RepID=A0A0D1YEE9_9PEZI|nr:uncharacterized protein PV09_09237 [Verruconis gallopava]KIV99071.1 hypothetical protein PV09_09237 [Verruconis gallopava]